MSEVAKSNRNIILIAAGVLALGVVIGGYLLGDGLVPATLWLSWAHPAVFFVALVIALVVILAALVGLVLADGDRSQN